MMADELLNAQDLITAKKHDTFHSEVITGKAGGLSTGANIDYATNSVTGQVQKTLPATVNGIDWSYVGKFADGVTFTKKTDFAIDANGTQWIYVGSDPFPKAVAAGAVPGEPDYQVVHVATAETLTTTEGFSVQEHIDGGVGKAHDSIYRRQTTVSEIASGVFSVGDKLRVSDRADAQFDVIAGVAPNGFDILDAGNGNAATLLVCGVLTADSYEKIIHPSHWGAVKSTVASPVDCSAVFNHIANIYRIGGATFQLGGGKYYFASSVDLTTTSSDLGQAGFKLQGLSKGQTELFTDQNIDLFLHNDRFIVDGVTIAQRGTKGTGVAMRSNGQCRFCSFTNSEIWWFKYGNLQRFSLWNTYRDMYYVQNACGIKLARSDDMEDVTNPSPTGSWNASNGWFHNQNSFENITFNGGSGSSTPNAGVGEVGFWGAIQGCNFSNITLQNYNRDGAQTNQILPSGKSAMPLFVVGGGPTSSRTFNNQFEDLYFEVNKNCMTFEDCRQVLIDGLFTQGQSGGEAFLTARNSVITIRGYTSQTAGFTNRFVLSDSSKLYTDGVAALSGASDVIDATSDHFETLVAYVTPKIFTITGITPATSGTIGTDTNADQLSYTIAGNTLTGGGRVDIGAISSPIGTYFEIGGLPKSVANLAKRAGNVACSVSILGATQTVCPAVILEGSTSIRVYYDCSTLAIGDDIIVHFDYFW